MMQSIESKFCCGMREHGGHGYAGNDAEADIYLDKEGFTKGPSSTGGILHITTLNGGQTLMRDAYIRLGWELLKSWRNSNSGNMCYMLGKVF